MQLPPLAIRLDAGPDAGRSIGVDGPDLVIGRCGGPGRIADPSLEVHHLLVRRDGPVAALTQLAGRTPARVDGEPLVGAVAVGSGSVVELGASRAVLIEDPMSDPPNPTSRIELGVGDLGDGDLGDVDDPDASFVEQAAARRGRSPTTVTLDLGTTRRLLVAGPAAPGLVRSIVAQAWGASIAIDVRLASLHDRPAGRHVVIVHRPELDAAWPGRELPVDGVVINVGATWAAVMARPHDDGTTSLVRFHAAGRPAAPTGDQGRTGRSSLSR